MKKALILIICLVAALSVWAQGLETFANFDYAETAYVDGSFVGEGGITWNYFHVTGAVAGANDNSIDGNGMILRRSAVPSRIVSDPIPNGIGNFSVQMRKAYTSAGDRQVALYINDVWVADSQIFGGASGADPTIHEFIVNGINIPGAFTMEIRHLQGGTVNRQLTIDNITWTAYGSGQQYVANPTFDPPSGHYGAPFEVSISTATAGASIYYTTDGSVPSQSSTLFTAPINVSTATTIKARAYAAGYEPSAIVSANYAFYVNVGSLSELWQQNPDNSTVYHVTGEVILTFKQNNRHQKYVQDAGAAILIDDLPGVITSTYNVGDAIAGLTGKLNLYFETLQFLPTADPGPAVSSGNNLMVPTVTVAQLNSDIGVNQYQSRLVQINDVSFTSPSGNYTTNPAVTYPISDATGAMNFRTSFYDVDYIDTPMHIGQFNVLGLIAHFQGGAQITPRMLADFNPVTDEVGSLGGVVSAAGAPLSGALIEVEGTEFSTGSAADGSYILHLIPVGTHSVTASKTGYTPVTHTVTILEGQTATLNFALDIIPVQVSVTGRIVGSGAPSVGLAGATINLSGFAPYEAITNATGQFAISGVFGNHTYSYSVSAPGFATATGDLIVGAGDVNMGDILLVENINPPQNVIATIVDNGNEVHISWQLPDLSKDRAFVGFYVYRFLTADQGNEANWMSYTTYPIFPTNLIDPTWATLPSGSYTWAVKAVYTGDVISAAAFSNALVKEEPQGNIVGHVISDIGVPIFGATVSAEGGYSSTTNAAGAYSLTVPVGIYLVSAVHANFSTVTQENVVVTANQDTIVNFVMTPVSNEDEIVPISGTVLGGNYPNPFNPETTISYQLKDAGNVRLDIFNVKGQLVRSLLNETQAAGRYQIVFNARDDMGNPLASGLYLYRFTSGAYSSTRKMMLME
ncbi:MAG: carboxypeptidase regulatory-like domain-containing protein [Candidatus Cloacimonadaceae bacterium]|nr:carboxypeptidase regulatory-like domain-containing protein [Candidatus Cloacimonadaceae bacterium]